MSLPEPCSWPVEYGECDVPEAYDALDDDARERFEHMATSYLWRWTGRGFGVCAERIRPCRSLNGLTPSTFEGRGPIRGGGTPWNPVLLRGEWFNVSCWSCGPDACGCDSTRALTLPGPVSSIEEVRIDGTVLDPADYRLDQNTLIRLDGQGWPARQNTDLPDSEEGTWSVTYERGVEVPEGGRVAAGILAVEFYKASCRDASCRLPERVQTITRQGVTVAMLDGFDDLHQGHTGIWLIDSWVASVVSAPLRPLVYSPDVRRPGRR